MELQLSPEASRAIRTEREKLSVSRESNKDIKKSLEEAKLVSLGLGIEGMFDAKARQENPNLDLPAVSIDGTDFGLPKDSRVDVDVTIRTLGDGSVVREVTLFVNGTLSPEEATAQGFEVHPEDKTFFYTEKILALSTSSEEGDELEFFPGTVSVVNEQNRNEIQRPGSVKSPEAMNRLMKEYEQALLRKDSKE